MIALDICPPTAMLTLPRAPRVERAPTAIIEDLRWAWSRTDRIFDLAGDALFERPIPLRHPLIFYVGHLPAFTWNHTARAFLGRSSSRPEFDELFERGIDPLSVEDAQTISAWPSLEEVLSYRDAVRRELPALVEEIWSGEADPYLAEGRVLELALEHELMHHETLLYILRELDHGKKKRPQDTPTHRRAAAPPQERIRIPAGRTILGSEFDSPSFGWDNEFPSLQVDVPEFHLDRFPITVDEFRAFLRAGGYENRELWTEEDFAWIQSEGRRAPHGWKGEGDNLRVRTLLEDVPVSHSGSWPAVVSGAEAQAYARWRGARLATEAELHRAAYGTPDGPDRAYPWGDEPPRSRHGNFDVRHLAPVPVGSHPAGRSAFGVDELIGNAWEWTSTHFKARSGFRPIPTYPGYSADFFDGDHLVLFGGSWATDRQLLRRSFRNWFQPRYPYVVAGFRLAWD